MSSHHQPQKWWHKVEENLLVLILSLMVTLTFINVILRGWFNSTLIWSLEATLYLFAWLVLLGLGYLVRTHNNLGVDVVINLMNAPLRRVTGLLITVICIAYALLLIKGSYDFSANFYNLPTSEGRIFPTGFDEMKMRNFKGYTPVFDIPMPDWLRPVWEPVFLIEGDGPYRKLPINIPYIALFLGVFWMFVRFIIAGIQIYRGVSDRLIASHEAESSIQERHEQVDDHN